MKKINVIFYIFITVCIAIPSLYSCSEDEETVNEWMANYVYLQKEDYMVPDNSFNLVHGPLDISGDNVSEKFVIRLKQPIQNDITVNLGTEAKDIPSDAVSLSSDQVTIKAGESVSEVITVGISDWSFAMRDAAARTYELKVKILDIISQNKNLKISEYQGTKSMKVDKSERAMAAMSKPDSWVALERNAWTAVATPCFMGIEEAFGAANALDGIKESGWYPEEVKDAWWSVVLDTPSKIDGFSVSYGFNPPFATATIESKIEYKKDGDAEWTSINLNYVFNASASTPTLFGFFEETLDNVKEIKVSPIATGSFVMMGLSEFNLYKNN